MQYDVPRLSPDGEHLFIGHMDWTTYKDTFIEFASNGTAVQQVATYTPPRDSMYEAFEISTPSREGHVIYTDYNYTSAIIEVVEIADVGGAFQEINRYPLTMLGDKAVNGITHPSLSPDGLRMVFLSYEPSAWAGGGATTNGGGPAPPGTDLPPSGGGPQCGGGGSIVLYADRETTSAPFREAQVIETLPDMVDWPYMTEDCGRIYVSALNRTFYFKQ